MCLLDWEVPFYSYFAQFKPWMGFEFWQMIFKFKWLCIGIIYNFLLCFVNLNYIDWFLNVKTTCFPAIMVYMTLTSVQFSSVAQSWLTLWDPMNRSMPGLPVHHKLQESTQTHVHWVSDAIQPSYPLSSPSPPASNPSQHQGLFQWVNSSHEVAKVLEFQLQHHLPMNTQDWPPLGWTGWISLQSRGLSRVFSNTTVQKHQFFSTQLSL